MIISVLFGLTLGMESLNSNEERYGGDMILRQTRHLEECKERFTKEFKSEELRFVVWAQQQILAGKNADGMLECFLSCFPVYADGLLLWYVNKSDAFFPPLIRKGERSYMNSLMRYSSPQKKMELLDKILQKKGFSLENYLIGSTLLEELPHHHKEHYSVKIKNLIEEAQGETKENLQLLIEKEQGKTKENLQLFIDEREDSGKNEREKDENDDSNSTLSVKRNLSVLTCASEEEEPPKKKIKL